MELSWLMKLRIAVAVAIGVGLIGLLIWPSVAPDEPFGLVSMPAFGNAIIVGGLAFLVAFVAYFLSWPYGREIGILAVPSGLAVWAIRSGSMANQIQMNPTLNLRQQLFTTLRWEPVFWLAIVALGFAGVLVGQKISGQKPKPQENRKKSKSKSNGYLNIVIALIGSVLIAQFLIAVFAQDVRMLDAKLGSVVAQPATGQIVFAVLVSFAITAFLVKKFLNASYIWPIIASALVTGFAVATYVKMDVLQHLIQQWPATFFANAATSILPIQMVAFGSLGSIVGYWLAVRYNYWREHELK
ncbi:MAG: hypothetical protein KAS75_06275 [Planctomycetes bacterium]|nr:hypothetical protein [Planctomycetota bacterium]